MSVLLTATVIAWGLALWRLIGVVRGPGVIRRLQRLVAAAVWVSLGSVLGAVVLLLQLFFTFSNETLVAQVTARRISPETFELLYQPVGETVPLRVELQGDQWTVSGGLIKWHPALAMLGLKSYHRPMRLAGQFSDLHVQRAHPPTVYPLQPALVDRFWEAMYWGGRHLPFVEAVYGSSAYAYVEPGMTQEIYVTPSGYLIKRFRH